MPKPRVLFLCTGNSARSQMAEGLLRAAAGDRFEVFSAGTEPKGLHPLAIQAMNEIGIDISRQRSKSVSTLADQPMQYVVTVCDSAKQQCPIFPATQKKIHWSFEDPAAAEGTEQEQLAKFREIRDQIRTRIHSEFELAKSA